MTHGRLLLEENGAQHLSCILSWLMACAEAYGLPQKQHVACGITLSACYDCCGLVDKL